MTGHILITGAASGLGAGISRRLAAAGPLILHGRDSERLSRLCRELPSPESHLTWVCDLSQPDPAQALAGFLHSGGAGVSGFVHCAGEFQPGPITACDPATVQRLFRVNFFSAEAILRALLDASHNPASMGSIVLLSSIACHLGAKGYSLYAATKGALNGLTSALASEIAPVRINSVLPGAIRTPGTEFLYESQGEAAITHGYPLGSGTAEDVAGLVDFLMSDAARWITGQQFVIDGGRTAGL